MRLALTAHDLIQCTNLTQPYEAEDGRGLNLLQAEGNDEVQRSIVETTCFTRPGHKE